MSWSAAQYRKFEEERNRPIHDLLAQVPEHPVARAIDLGCGPGNSTQLLLERFPDARVTGLDSSEDMIEAARQRLPDVDFQVGDITRWSSAESVDLILANASLQWVPDHASLLPALLARLAPGGSLAVQMPDNLDEPAHRLMREIASQGPWAERLADAHRARDSRHPASWYFGVLRDAGARVNVWRTVYHHALAGGPKAIVEWFKGSGLRPFLAPLSATEQDQYLARYEAAVAEAYPSYADGCVLLPFPRLFFVATR